MTSERPQAASMNWRHSSTECCSTEISCSTETMLRRMLLLRITNNEYVRVHIQSEKISIVFLPDRSLRTNIKKPLRLYSLHPSFFPLCDNVTHPLKRSKRNRRKCLETKEQENPLMVRKKITPKHLMMSTPCMIFRLMDLL